MSVEAASAGLSLPPLAIVILLGMASIGSAGLALTLGRSDLPRLETRVRALVGPDAAHRNQSGKSSDERRRLVEDTLREIEARERAKARRNPRPTLIGRMRQGGLGWSRSTYMTFSALMAVVGCAAGLGIFGLGNVPSLALGATAGLLVPHLYVSRCRNRRLRAFSAEFPNSLDVIVRGVQAGLSLIDCLEIISREAQEPVRREFSGLLHDQTMGVPLDEAVERLAIRVPLTEANFFAIVIAIQSRTGGNLAEALSNLAKVLRDRKAMQAKIKALSAEATASAMIIGSMPPIVALMLYLTSPDYVGLLFTTTAGNIALAGSAVWMTTGCLLMRKMINFDF